jgi:hypothetical protein
MIGLIFPVLSLLRRVMYIMYVYCKAESFFIFLFFWILINYFSFVGILELFVEPYHRSTCQSEFPRFFIVIFSSQFVTLSMK